MRLLFFGTPEFAVPSLQALLDRGDDVAAVICQPDRPSGRGQKLTPPPVKRLALERGLTVLQPEKLRAAETMETFRALAPELAVVAAYGRILSRGLLQLPTRGCINVHASLLPRHRGAAPIQSAILAGDASTGVTIMQMDEGMDTGAMLLQRATEIGAGETYGALQDRLAQIGAAALDEALAALVRGELKPTPQDDAAATMAPKIDKERGRIDWNRTAPEIERQVRAFNPWPSAYTSIDGAVLKIHRVGIEEDVRRIPFDVRRSESDEEASSPNVERRTSDVERISPPNVERPTSHVERNAGKVLAAGDELIVATGAGALRLLEVQAAGKQRLPGAVFARGARVVVGTRLG